MAREHLDLRRHPVFDFHDDLRARAALGQRERAVRQLDFLHAGGLFIKGESGPPLVPYEGSGQRGEVGSLGEHKRVGPLPGRVTDSQEVDAQAAERDAGREDGEAASDATTGVVSGEPAAVVVGGRDRCEQLLVWRLARLSLPPWRTSLGRFLSVLGGQRTRILLISDCPRP